MLPPGATLHARPAALLVRTAAGRGARITLRFGASSRRAQPPAGADARAPGGTRVLVHAEGDDADAALAAIVALLRAAPEKQAGARYNAPRRQLHY